MKKTDFRDQIKLNKRKSLILMSLIFFVIILLGYIISVSVSNEWFFIIMILSIVFSLTYILAGYNYSDKIALASVKAKPANNKKYQEYNNIVENMSIASGIPVPKTYIMPLKQINAFASGINPEKAVICVSEGAIEKLDKRELEAVIAHEMGHIKNYDIRYMTLVTVLVGMVAIISEIFLRSLWFSSGRNDKEKIGILIIGIILAIIAPILVKLVQLSISRKREYSADASAVMFTRNNYPLINALKKIENDFDKTNKNMLNNKKEKINKSISQLFFANPLSKTKIKKLGSTHPSIENRIAKLKEM